MNGHEFNMNYYVKDKAQSQTRLTLTSVRNFDKCFNAFALTGRMYPPSLTQGVALGYWLIGLSGRPKANPKLLAYWPFRPS